MNKNNTSCKDCCFAHYEEDTQTGCTMKVLDIYRGNGANILEAYDDDKAFYVIENKRCPYYRTMEWAKRVDPNSLEMFLKYENMPTFHVIINVKKGVKLDELKKTFDGFAEQKEIKYTNCTIIKDVDNLDIHPGDIGHLCDTMNLMVPATQDQKIKKAVKKTKSQYIVYVEAGHLPYEYLFETIDIWTNQKLRVFGVVKLNDSGGFIVPRTVYDYWYYQGDLSQTVIQNMEDYECKQQKKLIYKLEELLES